MRTNRYLSISFQGYLQNLFFNKESVEEKTLYDLLAQFEIYGHSKLTAPPLLYLIDYSKASYLVMTETAKIITSYDPRDFLDGGLEQLLDIFQPDDFSIYNKHVFPENISFLQKQPNHEHDKYIFSYNFRVKHKNGQLISLLQQGNYITSPTTGMPLYSMGYVVDITAFKQDNLIYHTIDEVDRQQPLLNKKRLVENFFYPNEEDRIISKRETCILCYMAEGLSSKQIAWKLRISENTIANHRKNMLQKTNCKNVAQLIAFACKNRII